MTLTGPEMPETEIVPSSSGSGERAIAYNQAIPPTRAMIRISSSQPRTRHRRPGRIRVSERVPDDIRERDSIVPDVSAWMTNELALLGQAESSKSMDSNFRNSPQCHHDLAVGEKAIIISKPGYDLFSLRH